MPAFNEATAGSARSRSPDKTHDFVFVVANEFPIYTLVLLTEPLRIANQNTGKTLFTWRIAAETRSDRRAGSGAWMPVDCDIDSVDHADAVIVLGGNLPLQQITRKTIVHLQRLAGRGCIIGATNTGTIILAAAGLLHDRRATIHWESAPTLLERYPDVDLVESLYVVDRDRVTCAGGVAALDMILEMIAVFRGQSLADEVAIALIHTRRRGDIQQRPADQYDPSDRSLAARMIALMENNIETPLDSLGLADQLGCSRRTMERASRRVLKDPPMRVYMKVRLQIARSLLFYDETPVGEIALICGFSSLSEFSRVFRAYFDRSPSQYREELRSKQVQALRPDIRRLRPGS